MTLGDVIKTYRMEHSLSMDEFAKRSGLSKGYISMLEKNRNPKTGKPIIPSILTYQSVAKAMSTSVDILMKTVDKEQLVSLEQSPVPASDDLPANVFSIQTKKVPLLGTIVAGVPIYADENFDGYRECTEDIDADFCLKIQGDSMIGARINDGDIVFIKKQPDVDNGEIAAVLIEDEATLKRVYKEKDSLILQAENPKYAPIVYTAESYVECRIMGKAVAFQSDIV